MWVPRVTAVVKRRSKGLRGGGMFAVQRRHFEQGSVQGSHRSDSLVFGSFGIKHGKEHVPIAVALGFVCTQYFS